MRIDSTLKSLCQTPTGFVFKMSDWCFARRLALWIRVRSIEMIYYT